MTDILEIEDTDINRLDEYELTKLLKRLLHVETLAHGLPDTSYFVALNIKVADGGEDGRIEWNSKPDKTEWLPNHKILFQCKESDLGPKDYYAEMLLRKKTSKILKPKIKEMLEKDGAYIVFTTQTLNQAMREDRIRKIREAIKDAGETYDQNAQIDIYDAHKIAKWTNNYFAAISQVCRAGRQLTTAMPLEEYLEYPDHSQFKFVRDDTNNGHMIEIKNHLLNSKSMTRIVGMSGTGKSRILIESIRSEHPDQKKLFKRQYRKISLSQMHQGPQARKLLQI